MAVLKYSRQREAIKNYLQGREDHPSADMVYDGIRGEFPNISLGTVYRNLSLLTELGEIIKIPTEGADRFDARVAPHNHFICKSCGRVMDSMISVKNPVEEINAQWYGGEVEECRMEFYGICNECKKMKN